MSRILEKFKRKRSLKPNPKSSQHKEHFTCKFLLWVEFFRHKLRQRRKHRYVIGRFTFTKKVKKKLQRERRWHYLRKTWLGIGQKGFHLSPFVVRFEPNTINKEWGWKKAWLGGHQPRYPLNCRGDGNSVALIIPQRLKAKIFLGDLCNCTNFTVILSHSDC